MLKGKVQIELHNHKTGLRDRIEQENLVTDAVGMFANAVGCANLLPNDHVTPITEKALGGIYLFDDLLTESTSNVFFPDNAKLIASAGQGTDTAESNRGSFNSLESGEIANGYMSVWDFSTSQANGLIKSLARTHYQGANNPGIPIFQDYGSSSGVPDIQKARYADFENNDIYRSVDDSGTSKLVKDKIYLSSLPVDVAAGSNYVTKNTPVSTVSIPTDNMIIRQFGGYSYYVGTDSSGYILNQIDPDDWSVTKIGTMDTNGYAPGARFTVTENYVYYCTRTGSDYTTIIRASLSDMTQKTTYSFPSGVTSIRGLINVGNNLVYAQCTYNNASYTILLYPDGNYVLTKNSTRPYTNYYHTAFIDEDNMTYFARVDYSYTAGMYKFGIWNYLGTICNLSSAVEKTSTMSMKVKYSLTNV